MSTMFTPPWVGSVQVLTPGGAGQAGRVGAGQVALSVVGAGESTSNGKRSAPSVRGDIKYIMKWINGLKEFNKNKGYKNWVVLRKGTKAYHTVTKMIKPVIIKPMSTKIMA